jgi:hypothetical protein
MSDEIILKIKKFEFRLINMNMFVKLRDIINSFLFHLLNLSAAYKNRYFSRKGYSQFPKVEYSFLNRNLLLGIGIYLLIYYYFRHFILFKNTFASLRLKLNDSPLYKIIISNPFFFLI